jgi:hypothetical protein
MSEKRKPELVFVAEIFGNNAAAKKKRVRLELFPAALWANSLPEFGKGKRVKIPKYQTRGDVYRLRVNGKWWKAGDKHTFTLSEVFMLFRQSVVRGRKRARGFS